MEKKETIEIRKAKRKRSPGYPLINLHEALEKAKILWSKEKTNHIPAESAAQLLGYKTLNGYAARVISALKQFDLIIEKHGDIMLTQNVADLDMFKPTDENYINVIKKIALKPNIINKLYNDHNGNLPSNESLRVKLIRDYGFHPEKIGSFINDLRKTLDFAGLNRGLENDVHSDGNASDEQGFALQGVDDKAKTGISTMMKTRTSLIETTSHIQKSYPIPLSKGKNAAIVFESLPVEKKDIDAIKKWLEFYSDNLTESE